MDKADMILWTVIMVLLTIGVGRALIEEEKIQLEQFCHDTCVENGYDGQTLSFGIPITKGNLRCLCDRSMLNGSYDNWTEG